MFGFSIVYTGRAKVILICTFKRKNEVTHYVKGLRPKLSKMYFGNMPKYSKEEEVEVEYVKQRTELAKKNA